MKPDRALELDSAVVVWIAQLSRLGDSLAACESLLDAQERERAARFRFPEDRARFVAGRGLLRHGLRRYAPHLPSAIELAYTGLGRPILPGGEQALHFSISHTHDLVALAFTKDARIGIDLEYMKAAVDPLELAERILSADDFHTFQKFSHAERPAVFYRAWTRKEAYLKALGEGIGTGLREVSVSLGPEIVSPVTDTRDAGASRWQLYLLPMPEDYMGALACDDAERRYFCEDVHFQDGNIVTAA
jgi:4'-phosphopantetheinyl transferase